MPDAQRPSWRDKVKIPLTLAEDERTVNAPSASADSPLRAKLMGSEGEAYSFGWRSSFDGNAMVRIGCQGDVITLRWRYDWFRVPAPDDAPAEAALSPRDWARLQDALIAANFWALEPLREICGGLDGADWTIWGRCGSVSRAVSRWSPGGKIHDLGRLFFALAGPPLSKIELY